MAKKLEFKNLLEALAFIAEHGGAVAEQSEYGLSNEYRSESGAFGPASSWVKCADGAIFGVEVYNNGPLSEVTPAVDMGVKLTGFLP